MSDFLFASVENAGRSPGPDAGQDSHGVALDRPAPDGAIRQAEAVQFERQILTLEASDNDSRLRVYQAQVEALQAQLNGLQAQFKSVSGDITGRIARLEAQLAAARSALARAAPEEARQTSTLQARKAGLASQLSVARQEAYTNEKSKAFDIGALMGAQADIEALARAIEGQLRSIAARIQALQLI